MQTRPRLRFELRGEFAGFRRNARGKRRLLLRSRTGELRVKVPKALRREVAGLLLPGCEIVITGIQRRDRVTGAVKFVASQIRLLAGAPPLLKRGERCSVRVCSKKNCWKRGGKELWEALERKIEAAGLSDAVRLKAVGCLDHCKRAPNLAIGGTHIERCTPGRACEMIERIAAGR